jgi:hypothetical protein
MPRIRSVLAAAAVLALLVPASAVSHPARFEAFLEATEISSAKVCGAGACREVSDPEVATALAVDPRPGPIYGPTRELPWYKSTLTIPAEDGGEVFRAYVTVVPSAGLMRWEDGTWLVLPSESKEAYTKLTAGLKPRPATTLLPAARVDEVFDPATAATPASDGSNVWIVALGAGVLAALVAGMLLMIRHRRASTPPAAPESPGAA